MGHTINYMKADRNVKKSSVIAEIDYEVEHVAWEEGGRYDGGQLTWHDDKIYRFRAGKPMVLTMG